MKKVRQLGRKITAMCLLLAALTCVAICTSGYFRYRNSIYKIYNDFGYDMAQAACAYVDGDTITSYLATGEPDAAYTEMARQLYTLYSKTSLGSIYICVPDPDTMTITNIYDVRVEEAEDKTLYTLGAVDPIGSAVPQHVVDVYLTGKRSSDYFLRKTGFGYNTSAIVPVYNSAGGVAALLVADVPMPYIQKTMRGYLLYTVCITALVVFLFMLLFKFFLQRQVVYPLRLITNEAKNFIKQRTAVSQKLLSVKTRDEIEELAAGVYQMEVDINTYIANLTAVTAEKERIGAELDVATHIQKSMLPCIFPPFPERRELDIYATMDPAKEVGGDFYDFFMVDDRHLAIVMADVSGKGVPAALFMVIGKTLIKDHTQLGRDLGSVFGEVNELLCESNSEGLFITAFEGVLDLVTGQFDFVNAGHEMPFICKAGEGYRPYKIRPGFVLAGMEGMRFKAGSMQFAVGDKIFQYTDGVTEATNAQNELYGMERLETVLNRDTTLKPAALLPAVKADIDAFVGAAPQFDDITMLCLEYKEQMRPEEDAVCKK